VTIRPLADFPQAVPLLAQWFHAEWHCFDARALAAIEAQLAQNFGRHSIPITFLAHAGSRITGTVSIDLSDLPPFDHLSPWLASLYVLPEERRTGIGTALVRHAQAFASCHAIRRLYLWTPGATSLYEKCGWTVSQRTLYNSKPITLMQLNSWEHLPDA
jgi:GNAT superfamily N-acetyltransferase